MNTRIIIIFLIFCLIGTSSFAQDTLRINKAIEIVLQNNFSISIAKNSNEISKIGNSMGNAGMLPKLDLSGTRSISVNNSHAEYFDGRVRDVSDAKTNNLNGGLQLSWTVFDGFNMFIQRDKLNELEKLSNYQLLSLIENTISQVSRIYYEIVVHNKMLEVYDHALENSKQRVVFAKAKLELGKGSQLDYLQAVVDMNADSAACIRQVLLINNVKSDLNLLLSRELKTPILVQRTIDYKKDLSYEQIWNNITAQSPALLEARSSLNIANLAIREIKSVKLPRLSINSAYSYSNSKSDVGIFTSNRNLGFSSGISLNYNLFNGFTNQQKQKIAIIREESAKLDLEKLLLSLQSDFQQIYNDYSTNMQLLDFENENLKFAEQNWQIAQEKYKLGALNVVELRSTHEKLIDAESRLLQAMYRCKSAEIELMRLSGQFSKQQ